MSSVRDLRFALFILFCLGIGLTMSLSGCDCDDNRSLGGTRHLEANPQSLTFDVQEGEEQTKTVLVTAKVGLIRITSIELLRGKDYFTLDKESVPEVPLDLEEGKSFRLRVHYKAPADISPVGTIRIESDATIPAKGQLDIQLLSQINLQQLTFKPNPVDFGELQEGTDKTIEVTGQNTGRAKLKITQIAANSANSPGFTFPDGLPKTPLELEPGATFTFKVNYKPTPRKPDLGVIEFSCEGNCSPADPDPARRKDPYQLQLQGTLAAPTIEVTPQTLDFGFVEAGQTADKTFRIANIGGAILKISEISFKAGSSGAFIMPTITNVEIQPGRSKEVAVQYRPGSQSTDQGTIEIKNNDPARPLVAVPVSGKLSAPDIDVIPKTLNFGKVPVKKQLAITISNAGDRPLIVQPPTFLLGSKEFSFATPQNSPITVDPNKFHQLQVVYSPQDKIADTDKIIIKSNDPDEPEIEVLIKGEGTAVPGCDLVPSPKTVNFGLSVLGRSKVFSVIWTNQGSKDCTITHVQADTSRAGFPPYTGPDVFHLPNPPKECPNGACSPNLVIKPGSSIAVDVSFHPLVEKPKTPFGGGGFEGTLQMVTKTMQPPTQVANLTGFAVPSCIEVVPDTLDFGLVTVNCSSQNEKIIIYNTCTQDINVTGISFAGGNANGFRIVKAQKTPFTIPAGQSAQIEMAYRSTPPAQKQSAILEIVHSVTQQSPLNVPLVATGTTTADQTDTFKQAKGPKADILFVIDNSCSMGNDQQNLGNNFSSFIKWALTLKVDFQIGITTTDVSGGGNPFGGNSTPGELYGSPKIMTPQTPNLETVFKQNALVGTSGGGSEQGLEATRLALSHPLITTGSNKGFLRADASLSIIAISDEPDQSSQPVQYYINFLKNIKGIRNPGLLRYNVVIGYDPVTKTNQCPGNGTAQATSKGRYVAVAQATAGVIAPICDKNWSGTLSKIGAVTFGLKKQFFLSRPADPTSIKVKVDGVAAAQGTGADQWTYNAGDNSVAFGAAPKASATVQISYKAICF